MHPVKYKQYVGKIYLHNVFYPLTFDTKVNIDTVVGHTVAWT